MSHKIMVVDDNSATRRMVRNALQRKGHDVLEAPDGKTARELMQAEHPRVVLQDLMLPDADGFALVGELRDLAEGTDVSILAFSGFVSELDEARVSAVGFDDIIAKPIAPSRLVPIVEAHLPSQAPVTLQFGGGRRIVIADDEPMQLKLATFRLSRLGFEVEAVSDGKAALEAIRRRIPDAIVSDVMMPELDGFGLAMAVRQDPELRRLPLVLVTSSYVEPGDRELARRAGASDLVPRTPELGELIEALRATMSEAVAPEVRPEALPDLEREHNQRVFRQLERQVLLNTGLAKRCSALAS
ncbi:MAG: response regulator, partial [Kofleriaceae bacterium]